MAVIVQPKTPFPLVPVDAPHTTADLKYYTETDEVPYYRLYEDPNLPQTNVVYKDVKKNIYDLRPLVEAGGVNPTDVQVTGFQFLPKEVAETQMKEEDWDDEEKIRSVYYEEVDQLLKKVTGATRTIIFDHTIRKKERPGHETPDTPQSRKPVTQVHIDQTPASGRKRVLRHGAEDGERLLRGRAQLINIWRPLRGPVLDAPLAVADARTLKDSHLVHSRLIYPPGTPEGETFQIKYSDKHQWYYVSEMQPDEALLLKCWDNSEDGGARTPHTGFVDDKYKGQEIELPRQSIEVRVLVFHEVEE
ncbi:7alpha-cephem-methoxylase P8 chain related protein [Pseudohyphozyma bogoriensis]|nr:7alpha-cephem-methoxylase P8 chain related protein [Pseudohyphozyma bogoriensis]